METRDYLMSLARDEALASDSDPIERVRQQMMKNRQAREIAIATSYGIRIVRSGLGWSVYSVNSK